MGRGTPSVLHPGNVFFRCLVDDCKNEYVRSKSNADKNILARQIVDAVASKGGRFLSKVEFSSKTVVLGVTKEMKIAWVLAPEEIVLTKVKQCMRDLFKRTSQHENQERHKPQASGRITALGSKIQVSELSNRTSISSKPPPNASLPFSFLPALSQQTPSFTEQAQRSPSGASMKDAAVWPLLQLHHQDKQQQQQEVSDRVRDILSQYASLGVNQTAAAQTLLSLNAGTKQGVGPSLADVEKSAGSAAHGLNSDVGCPAGGSRQEAAWLSVLCRRQMELAYNYSPARSCAEINHMQQSNSTGLMQRQIEPRVSVLHSPMLASEKALMALLLLLQEQNGRNSLTPVYASALPNHFTQVHRQSTQERGLSRPPPHPALFESQLSSLLSQLINNNAHSVPSSQQTPAPSPVDLHPINTMMAEMLMNRLLSLSSSTETTTIQGEDRKPRRQKDEK